MPDPQTFLLPSRAFILSQRDQNLPLRRAALADAEAHYADIEKGGYLEHLALVALIGETLQIVEDLGALANSFFAAPQGTAFFAALTNYNSRAINNFYSSLKKRPLEDFLQLLGFRIGGVRLEDALVFEPSLTAAVLTALEEVHLATATLVRTHMVNLANDWDRYRRFHHAFKHGLIVVNPEDVSMVENRQTKIDGVCVWMRKRDFAYGFGQIEPPYEETMLYVVGMGRVALDVLTYLVDFRVNFFDLVDLRGDGSWSLRPMQRVPWLWWFDKKDVSQESRRVITERFGIEFS